MKREKIFLSAVTALAASAVLTASASAYIEVVEDTHVGFTSDNKSWKVNTELDHNDIVNGAAKLQFIIELKGDTDKYEKERELGYYDNGAAEGEETPFVDFTGTIAVGAAEWVQFGFSSLQETDGDADNVSVKSLGDNKYLLTADLSDKEIVAPDYGSSLSIGEWGNKSEEYYIAVDEVYLYADDGSVLMHYDATGNVSYEYEPFDDGSGDNTGTDDNEPAATEETTTTTTAAPATESDSESAAETTTTTAAQNTPSGTAAQAVAVNSDFGSRDSSLIIVGIVAGVVIVALIVAIVVVMMKKKK